MSLAKKLQPTKQMGNFERVLGVFGFLLAASFSLIDGVADILLAIQHYKCADHDTRGGAINLATLPKPPTCPILQTSRYI